LTVTEPLAGGAVTVYVNESPSWSVAVTAPVIAAVDGSAGPTVVPWMTGAVLAAVVKAANAVGAPPVSLRVANVIRAFPVSLVEVAATGDVVASSPARLC
jgi:hypothetical protein